MTVRQKKRHCSFCGELFESRYKANRFCNLECDKAYNNLSAGELWILQGENKKRCKPSRNRLWGLGKEITPTIN